MKNHPMISDHLMCEFLSRHRMLPDFRTIAEQYFVPLAARLPALRSGTNQLLLGISGAQGTGKSTLADFLKLATTSMFDWNVAVLSIDDFYYTLAERGKLAAEVHPLLLTRGVPGTHDTDMLLQYLDRLQGMGRNDGVALPRFDKAVDDRADESLWPVVNGPVDLIILEGWCVGTLAQTNSELELPVNALERDEDADGGWRNYVNDQLQASYKQIFAALDFLVFLRAPSFEAILRWRLEQEEKLAKISDARSPVLMGESQITRFIQFYERLTRANLASLPAIADVVFRLDETHSIVPQDF